MLKSLLFAAYRSSSSFLDVLKKVLQKAQIRKCLSIFSAPISSDLKTKSDTLFKILYTLGKVKSLSKLAHFQ